LSVCEVYNIQVFAFRIVQDELCHPILTVSVEICFLSETGFGDVLVQLTTIYNYTTNKMQM